MNQSGNVSMLTVALVAIVMVLSGATGYLLKTNDQYSISNNPVVTPKVLSEVDNTQEVKAVDAVSDWKTYTNEKYGFEFKFQEEDGFQVKYQDGVTVNSSPKASMGELLGVEVDKMADIADEPAGNTKENAYIDKAAIEKGDPSIPFNWGVPESYKIINIPGAAAKELATLQAFDICDVQFSKTAFIYKDDYRITLYWDYSGNEIVANNPDYFTLNAENCGDQKIWKEDSASTFYKDLLAGKTDSVSRKWASDFDQIIASVKFSEKK
jgi:hypothetical protein